MSHILKTQEEWDDIYAERINPKHRMTRDEYEASLPEWKRAALGLPTATPAPGPKPSGTIAFTRYICGHRHVFGYCYCEKVENDSCDGCQETVPPTADPLTTGEK
jgi:hypothetical protein